MRLLVQTILVATLALLAASASAHAQASLPDVDIYLIAMVEDAQAWAALHQEALGTVGESKPLRATLPAATGGDRSIVVYQPKFTASVLTGDARPVVRIAVSGKLRGAEALAGLTAFEIAAMQVQAGTIANELGLAYGLTGVSAHLLELHLTR